MFYTENEPQEAVGKDKNVDDHLCVRLDYAFQIEQKYNLEALT